MASAPASTSAIDMLRFLLVALGVIVLMGGGAVALLTAVAAFIDPANPSKTSVVLNALGIGLTAGVAAILMFTAAALLRLLTIQVHQSQHIQTTLDHVQTSLLQVGQAIRENPEASGYAEPVQTPASPAAHSHLPGHESPDAAAQMLELLQQLRDVTMMNDLQRQHWASRHWGKRKELLTKMIDRHITTAEWAVAFARMEELKSILPDDADVLALEQRLTQAQSARLHDDVTAARLQLRHLMSITAWQQAEELANGLQTKYPHVPEVQQLLRDMHHERDSFENDNMQRLFLDLHDASERRQWRRAVQVAEELIRRYPNEKRVEKLRKDLPTIKENADSLDRKEQEELFKDLLNRQRYDEAAALANSVIEKYPTSSAAQQLMKLLPKVEELIRQERMKRQTGATT